MCGDESFGETESVARRPLIFYPPNTNFGLQAANQARSGIRMQTKVTYKDPADLMPRANNPRTHSKKQIQQIGASIKEFGFINPVLIDGNDGIIAGHGRVEAAKAIGVTDVPVICVDHLTPSQIRAYVIADNRIAENAGWDRALLALELQELSVDLNFDVTITGFETAEIDLLIEDQTRPEPDASDAVPESNRSMPATSRRGDLWQIGSHRLLCGDALNKDDYDRLLGSTKAQMVFTDPPYNVAIAGHVSGLGKVTHREFAMAAGEMSFDQFTAFLQTVFARFVEVSVDGSIHFICMDWRHLREVSNAGTNTYRELKNVCVWSKTNAGMGSLYRSQHELVFVFKNGASSHINNVELGRFGRNRTNVWVYAGQNSFGEGRSTELAMHPTVKPVALVADAILDCSKRGGAILDGFAGSGSTLIAAEKTGRHGYGIEIDPHYVDTISRRFETSCGIKAILAGSTLDFASVTQARQENNEP
jgi:DNA modification methylase